MRMFESPGRDGLGAAGSDPNHSLAALFEAWWGVVP